MSAMGLVTTLGSAVQQANLSLDFVNQKYSINGASKTFNQPITFSRSSVGTYFGADGLLRTAAVDAPRIEYDPITKVANGFLAEDARVNMTNYSSTFANSAWVKAGASIVPNQAVAPDGTLTADKLVEDTTTGTHFASRTITVAASTAYTWSIFVKAAERTFALVQFGSFANQVVSNVVYINLLTGAFTATDATRTRIQALPNGWFRVSTTVTTTATGTAIVPSVYSSAVLGSSSYAGNGTSGIYIWGGSMELGAFPTSHIATPAVFTSRASTATYFDSAGLMQTAGSGVARTNAYGRDSTGALKSFGLLTEAASTNFLKYSEQFDNAAWSAKVSLTATPNATSAPDGNLTGDKLVEGVGGTAHYQDQIYTSTFTTGTVFSGSYFVKAAERKLVRLNFYYAIGAATGVSVYFDLANKVVLSPGAGVISSGIVDAGNGWLRCWFTAAVDTPAETRLLLRILLGTTGLVTSYAGDGVSGVYAWGAQLEQGAFVTSYIQTTAAAVTRAADVTSSATGSRSGDVASIALDPTWFNASEFTVCSESQVQLPRNESSVRVYEMSTIADNNNRAGVIYNQSASTAKLQVVTAGTNVADLVSAALTSNAVLKSAVAVKLNDFAASFNGSTPITDTAGAMPTTMERMYIACFRTGINQPNGYIRTIQVFNRRLSNTVLQVLSS